MSSPLTFAHEPLNRESDKRTCDEWFANQRQHESRIVIPMFQGKVLVVDNKLVQLENDDTWLEEQKEVKKNLIFLGCHSDEKNSPVFMLCVEQELFDALNVVFNEQLRLVGVRQCILLLSREEVSIVGYGAALMHWHQSCEFCGFCGIRTRIVESGHARQCTSEDCGKLHFPRKDPVVIALVEHTDENGVKRCLLAGHNHLPSNVLSTLAGFVEHGESIEQAVAREVFEETGVRVSGVSYLNSQPWPFPNSLMLGFLAKAETKDIVIDENELSSANWFTAQEVRQMEDWLGETEACQNGWKIPRKESIARFLIEHWLESTA